MNRADTLYTDYWYTSPILAKYFYGHKINLCGTVRKDRRGSMLKMADPKQTGDIISLRTDMMMVVRWKDNGVVSMLKTNHENKLVEAEKRDR